MPLLQAATNYGPDGSLNISVTEFKAAADLPFDDLVLFLCLKDARLAAEFEYQKNRPKPSSL